MGPPAGARAARLGQRRPSRRRRTAPHRGGAPRLRRARRRRRLHPPARSSPSPTSTRRSAFPRLLLRRRAAGRPVLDLVHPDDRHVVRERIQGILDSHQPSKPRQIRFLAKDGSTLYAETSGIYIPTASDPVITVMARDVTERRRADARGAAPPVAEDGGRRPARRRRGPRLQQHPHHHPRLRRFLLERIEAERPPTMPCSTSAARPPAPPASPSSCSCSRAAARRSLAWSAQRRGAPMGGLLRRVIGEDIQLRFSSTRACRTCKVDPGQIEQMILNLASTRATPWPRAAT